MAVGYDTVDVICNRYFKRNLKGITQKGQRSGSMLSIRRRKNFPVILRTTF